MQLYGVNLCVIAATITVLILIDELNGDAGILYASTTDCRWALNSP